MQDYLAQNWPYFLLATAVILGITFVVSEDATVSRRVFWRFFVNIALPMLVLLGLPLMWLALSVELEPRVLQALLAGLVIAGGWLTTAIFSELEKVRGKAERLRDYHKAIYAEIGNTLAAFYGDGQADDFADAILTRMRTEPDFVPFIPRESHDRVFAALVEDIEVLPRQTIDAIIAFYAQVTSIAALADDMRGARFQELEQDRRIAIYSDYVDMRGRARKLGEYALRLIKTFSDGGASAADKVIREFNSPDADPRHPSAGSE